MDVRDVLISLNIVAMLGGAFYMVGALRSEIKHLAAAIEALTGWLEKVQGKVNETAETVAALKAVRK